MRERLSILIGKLKSRQAAMGAILATFIKGCGALLTLAVFTLAARAMSADQFGHLAVWFNAVSFLAVAAVFGQDTLIARSFGEYAGKGDNRLAWGAYRFGWLLTVASGLIFSVAMVLVGPVVFPKIWRCALFAPAFFLFTQTLLHYSSHSTRVIVNFVVSEITRDVLWRLVLLATVAIALMGSSLTLEEFFIAGGVGQILSLIVALYYVRRASGSYVSAPIDWEEWRLWLSRSLPMWQSAILEAANLYVDVILIGYVASAGEAGHYFAAARIANVFLMVSGSMNTYTFAHSANLFYSGQIAKLQSILLSLVSVCVAVLAPLWLLIYFFGGSLLTIFGARYAVDYPTLLLLATGCFLMSACGWPSVVLLTTGQEKIYSKIMSVAMLARIVMTALLAWRFGAVGAAWGWVLVNVPLFVGLSVLCYRKSGVDTSILSALGPLREKLREALLDGRRNPT
jgi:O-antigen/teichoic acid export membrane protein